MSRFFWNSPDSECFLPVLTPPSIPEHAGYPELKFRKSGQFELTIGILNLIKGEEQNIKIDVKKLISMEDAMNYPMTTMSNGASALNI
ncbi:hypothetical protein AVEN_152047-1 [Araneus ventricosus]|uniref:Uncharacterized protein n=1 Tax=Araneus ventricosus TaxID=182803 RepID=A0A4Y2WH29_ARAVE|nr:hypothetical protein AVEN_152047-1 [Araneus ventricosus]